MTSEKFMEQCRKEQHESLTKKKKKKEESRITTKDICKKVKIEYKYVNV